MAMVTEMHLRAAAEGGVRFNYRGHHRYAVTLAARGPGVNLAEEKTVLAVLTALRETSRAHDFEVYAYCFLPDKLAMIIRGKSDDADMKKFLAAFRPASAAAAAGCVAGPLWARKYQERVLRKTEITRALAAEMFRLPVKAGIAPSPSAYPFQGSFVLPPGEASRRSPRPESRRSPRPPSRRPPGSRGGTGNRFGQGGKGGNSRRG
jgi:putative transposase